MLRSAALVPFIVLLSPLEEPAFSPEEGQRLRTSWSSAAAFDFGPQTLLVDGEEMPGHGAMPAARHEVRSERVFLDAIGRVEDGRATQWVREYERIEATRLAEVEMPDGVQSKETVAESELEGARVLFDWDADGEGYDVSFEGDEGDEALLDGLLASIDGSAFLPSVAVEEGDSWEVPVSALALFLAPGGHLAIESEERSWSDAEMAGLANLSGDVTCSAGTSVEQDGRTLFEIELSVEAETSFELEDEEGESVQETHYELEGMLRWDLEAGHLASAELEGDVRMLGSVIKEVDMGERTFQTERRYEILGEASYKISVEAP